MQPVSRHNFTTGSSISDDLTAIIKQDKLPDLQDKLSSDKTLYKSIDKEGRTLLMRALAARSPKIAQFLIDSSETVLSYTDKQKQSALHYAVAYPTTQSDTIIENLLNKNLDCCLVDCNGMTPLHLAISNQQDNLMTIFLSRKSDPDTQLIFSLFCLCIKTGTPTTFTKLLCYSSKEVLQWQDDNGMSTLHHAVESGKTEFVELLLTNGADKDALDKQNRTPLTIAYQRNLTELISVLLRAHVDVCRGTTVYHAYVHKGSSGVQELKAQGLTADTPFHNGQTIADFSQIDRELAELFPPARPTVAPKPSFFSFSSSSDTKICGISLASLLKSDGYRKPQTAHPEQNTFLHEIAISPNVTSVQLGKIKGWDIKNSRGETPFLYCARKGTFETIRKILPFVNVNDVDSNKNSALHLAASDNPQTLCPLLPISKLELQNCHGQTPLHLAVIAANSLTVTQLLRVGANEKAKDIHNNTPLHWVSIANDEDAAIDVAELLVSKGADVNATNVKGLSCVHSAASRGKNRLVSWFCTKGAILDTKDTDGTSPLVAACEARHFDVADTLIKNKANRNEPLALMYACQQGNATITSLLLRKKLYVDGKKIKSKRADAQVKIDLARGIKTSPLQEAIGGGSTQIIQLLLENGAKINKQILSTAFQVNNLAIVQIFAQSKKHKISEDLLEKASPEARALFEEQTVGRSRSSSISRSRSGSIIGENTVGRLRRSLSNLSLSRSNSRSNLAELAAADAAAYNALTS